MLNWEMVNARDGRPWYWRAEVKGGKLAYIDPLQEGYVLLSKTTKYPPLESFDDAKALAELLHQTGEL